MLDGNLNFNDHFDQVKNVCRASLFNIRALRHIRPPLTEEMANAVACALVHDHSRADYANSLYKGMSSVNFDKLQLVQNTLARVVTVVDQPPSPDLRGGRDKPVVRLHCPADNDRR